MANLFWKRKKETKALLLTPFKTEEELEKAVFNTTELHEDLFLLKRQVRGGRKQGIPDIIGVDLDGNICIIEMKNSLVDASIIPQVLGYALWAETNPDSIKSLWLECDNTPENISIDWDNLQVRILVIAPQILPSTLDLVDKINYPVDLIEVTRWLEADNEFLLINKLEPERKKKIKPIGGIVPGEWDKKYKELYNPQSVEYFMQYAEELDEYVRSKGWDLDLKYNRYYCVFKAGFFNAFGIYWIGSKSFGYFFKVSKQDVRKTKVPEAGYDDTWKQAFVHIEPGKTKLEDYSLLFELAYKRIAGD